MDLAEGSDNSTNKMSTSRLRKYCSVFGCLMNSRDKPELSFFAVPKEPEKRIQWLQLISREDMIDKQTKVSVCEYHFHPNDIVKNDRKRIVKGKVPTLYLPSKTKSNVETQTCTFLKNSATQTDHSERGSTLKEKTTEKAFPLNFPNKTFNVQTQTDAMQNAANLTDQSTKDISKANTQTIEEQPGDFLLKIKSEPDPDLTSQKRLREFKLATSKIDMFYRLCDRFLSKNLANLVKAETHLKTGCKEDRKQGILCHGPRSLKVLCQRVIKRYKLIPEKKKFTAPETFSFVGGKPLRKRSERPPSESEVKKEKKGKKGKNPRSLAVLCQMVIREYNLLPQCEETENQLLIKINTPPRKRGRPLKSVLQKKNSLTKRRGRPRKDQMTSNKYGVASTSYSTFLEQSQDIRQIKVEQDLFLDQPPEQDPLQEDDDDFTVIIKEENDVESEQFIRKVTVEVPQGIVINPMAQVEIPGPHGSSVVPRTMTVVVDNYQLFANSIAEQLRALPPNRALLLQFDIQSMIDNEKQLMRHES